MAENKYEIVKRGLQTVIESGKSVGDKLPTESELMTNTGLATRFIGQLVTSKTNITFIGFKVAGCTLTTGREPTPSH